MSYVRKTWECGETITADALNNIEGGVEEALECCGGGMLFITAIHDNDNNCDTLDKTWQEIWNAVSNGSFAMIRKIDSTYIGFYSISSIYESAGDPFPYCVDAANIDDQFTFTAENATDYPSTCHFG